MVERPLSRSGQEVSTGTPSSKRLSMPSTRTIPKESCSRNRGRSFAALQHVHGGDENQRARSHNVEQRASSPKMRMHISSGDEIEDEPEVG